MHWDNMCLHGHPLTYIKGEEFDDNSDYPTLVWTRGYVLECPICDPDECLKHFALPEDNPDVDFKKPQDWDSGEKVEPVTVILVDGTIESLCLLASEHKNMFDAEGNCLREAVVIKPMPNMKQLMGAYDLIDYFKLDMTNIQLNTTYESDIKSKIKAQCAAIVDSMHKYVGFSSLTIMLPYCTNEYYPEIDISLSKAYNKKVTVNLQHAIYNPYDIVNIIYHHKLEHLINKVHVDPVYERAIKHAAKK